MRSGAVRRRYSAASGACAASFQRMAAHPRAATFLLADDGRGVAVITREAADDGRVIRVTPVALQLDELLEQPFYEVERVGAFRVARQLDALERRQRGV